ncbi:hypothetical protein [Tabrizicola sp.]|uniref:hypothetical protein n=1 Tax=Tabrizicola sp. TaxID=2005166 RepID=UPI003F3759A8
MPFPSTASALSTLILASSVQAHEITVDTCATDPVAVCALEIDLPDFQTIDADPRIVDGQLLRLLGADPAGRLTSVDVSLADGAVAGSVLLDLVLGLPDHVEGLIAADGKTFAVYPWTGEGDRGGFRFYDATGKTLGTMSADVPDGWQFEYSPAETLGILAGQNRLTFDETALRGTFYRFELYVSVADGTFDVRELHAGTSGTNPLDTLDAYLGRLLAGQGPDPGYEYESFVGPLSAVTTEASDGNPSRLSVRSEEGGEVFFDQRLGPARRGYDYRQARLSPDGARLAVIRTQSAEGDSTTQLMVFDVATTAPTFAAELWQEGPVVWLPDNRIAVLQADDQGGTQGFAFDLPPP